MKLNCLLAAASAAFLVPLVAVADTNCVAPPSGLLSWWPAEGDARDAAGRSDGILMYHATFAPGLAGQAFSLEGTNSCVRLPDNLFPVPSTVPASTPFSFETWFKTPSGGVILGQETGVPFASADGWVPGIYVGVDGRLRVEVFWSGSGNPAVSTQSVADNLFHHVAVTYDGAVETVYLDGQLMNSRPFTQVSYASSYSYQLGVGNTSGWPQGNGTWFPFQGLIDEAALYNRALASNEVAAIFLAGAAGKCASSLPPVITQPPPTLDVPVGSAATLTVGVRGAAPLLYQWQFYGTNLPAGTNATLVLTNIAAVQAGPYSVLITNAFGSAQSATGLVTVVFSLALDATVSDGAPFAGAGNLESPGSQDVYSFDAPTNRVVYLQVNSAFNRLFWTLTAPDGTAVFTGHYMPNNDVRRLELPMHGTYRLVVYNDSGITGAYSFTVSAVADQAFAISVGNIVTNGIPTVGAGNLEMPGSQDDYLFSAPTNGIVYLNVLSAYNRLFWSLFAPDGTAIFTGHYMPYNDVGRLQLPTAGTYRLRVYNDDIFTGSYSFSLTGDQDQAFAIAVGDTVTNGAPATGAGNLEAAGTWDDYTFTAPTNRLVYFDVLSAPFRLFWSLYAADGSAVFSGHYMPYNDVGRITLPHPGTYRLRVYSDSASTGAYSFRLSPIIADASFTIAVGDTVTNGVPALGAGNLEAPGTFDDYSFDATTNPVVYLDVLSAPFRLFWTLVAPDNSTVFSGRYMPNNDIRRLDLPMPGTYRLRVYSDFDGTGTYSFRLSSVVDQTIDLALGVVATNGVPIPGAGNLETPGAYDDYLFTAPTNRAVFFNTLSAPYRLFWTLFAPDGSTPFSGRYFPNNDVGRVDLPTAGTYRLRLYSDTDATGPYSFVLSPIVDQSFNIAIGSTVTNGIPAPGAGVLQSPGADDLYLFTAAAGQSVHFNDRDSSPRVASWRLVAPGGAQIFNDSLNGGDPGSFTLPATGSYLLHVHNNSAQAPANYSFALLDNGTNSVTLPPTDRFSLGIGDLVSNALPSAGAGNLESPGSLDIYTFTSVVGQVVFFEDRGSDNNQIRYDVYDSDWNPLFGEWLNGSQDIGRRILSRGGTYYIVASGNNNTATGAYSFKLWSVADQSFSISVGDLVSNALPASGAGNVETPGVHDVFSFTVTPGEAVFFEDRGATPNSNIRYDLYDDQGVAVFGEWLNGYQDIGRRSLERGGTYTLVVSGAVNVTGTYSFKLWPVTGDQTFAINLGDTISNGEPVAGAGNLEAPGVRDIYTFTAAPSQEVYFEDRGASPNGNIRYDVYDSENTFLFGEWLSGGQDIGRQTLVSGGVYKLIVSGYQNVTGTYSLKLWPVAADQFFAFNLGDLLTDGSPGLGAGNIEAPGARDIYTFTAVPGQVVFFEDRGSSPNGQFRYDVYDDRGVLVFGEWLEGSQAVGRQTLTRGGTYTLVGSGYANYSGTYALKVWPVTDQSFSLNIGDVVTNGLPAAGAGNIETPGVHDLFTFTAKPEQLVYFEDRGASSYRNIRYDVYDSNGAFLFGEWLGSDQEVGLKRLSLGGTYTIVVSPYVNVTGTYSFRLWDALPHILEQPADARSLVGQPQTFGVRAESPFALTYQWQFNGTNLPGATNVILQLSAPAANQAGPYDVIVANVYGAVTSTVATLTIDSAELYVTGFSPSGPVDTNVSQLRVQFNSPLQTGSLTASRVAITGPGGPLDSSNFTIVPIDSQTFLVNLPAQSSEGDYFITLGPSITNQAGVGMTGGALFPLYTADFEPGADGAWSRSETLSNAISTRFLGEFGNESATLLMSGLPPHSQLRLVWDALIIDTWDGNLNGGPDYFGFNLTGSAQPAWEYTFHESGNPQAQSYPAYPDVSGVNFAGGGNLDSIYRNLRFDFAHTNGTLEVSFYGRNLEGIANEGWGVDNVRVLLPSAANGAFNARFTIDKTGPLVTNLLPTGTNVLPISSLTVTFNEPIQPQTFTSTDVVLLDPFGRSIPMGAPVRLSATEYQLSFASQRSNGLYTVTVGPAILDLAGNPMATAATFTFNLVTPPVITTPPASLTLVRNNTAIFTVTASATPPVQYLWSFNGSPISGATTSMLTLPNVQTNQSGSYQVTVTDAGGSVTSTAATLTVLPTYGPFIAQAQAARLTVPAVPGNGVFIELFNGIGGGAAPVPALVSNLTPSGTTLSPVIDFPHPGQVINVGNSFDVFFEDTTRPPDQVLGLSALNFILRHTFYLAVTRADDVHPETPEIDLRLGVGSDDGFYLQVGTNFLGSAGDRGFTYSWMDVSFQDEGLYLVTLLYAANAVGQSGLELSWQVGTNGATPIIPQSVLYLAPDLGDRLITFEEVPAGTLLSDQYASTGAVFTVVSGALQVTTNFPTQFVPVTAPNVFGDPNPNPSQPGIFELTFVSPGSTNRATSDFVSFFMLNAQNNLPTVTAFDAGGNVLFTNSYHGGGASKELVSISAHGIARVRINLGQGTNTAAIDNLAFLAPVSLPDLVVAGIQAPSSVIAGQPIQLVWQVLNQGFSAAPGPWTDTVSLSANGTAASGQLLTSLTYSNPLPPGGSLTVTQSVIIPASQAGTRWFVVTANASHSFPESGSITNNSAVAPVSTSILAPDLAVRSLAAPASAQLGQAINVTWSVQNAGTAAASVPWSDRLVLSLSSNSLVNPVPLLATPALGALGPGATYTNTQSVALPLNGSLTPGSYFLLIQADPNGAVADANPANNLLSTPLTLSLPPLPDLAVGQVSSPASASAGDTITISWAVTNIGPAIAGAPWRETVYLVPGGVPQPLFATNPTLFPLVGSFSYSNALPAGVSVVRTQQVAIPRTGVGGALKVGIIADPDNALLEPNKANNAALAANDLQVPVSLFLSLPATNVVENIGNLSCLVSRNGDLTASIIVSLSSSATNHLQVPATVTIPAGAPSAPFTAVVLDDGIAGPDSLVTVAAQAGGYATAAAQIVVVNTDLPPLALSLSSAQVIQGQTVSASVSRSPATGQPLTVSLVSSTPTALVAPSSVTIPANTNSALFTLLAVQNTLIQPPRVYTLSASAAGFSGVTTNITVFNNNTPSLTLTLDRTNISEADGPFAAVGTVTRFPVTDQAVTIGLVSSNTDAATVPAQVAIPGLQASATFYIAAVDDDVLSGPKLTQISAQVLDSTGVPVGGIVTQPLTVQDNDGPALKVSIAARVVSKGINPATMATVSRNTPPTNSLAVMLIASDPGEVSIPSILTLSNGQTSATFAIASLNDGIPHSSHTVLLTAAAAAYASGSDQLLVSDVGLPDLIVSSITVPAAGFNQEPLVLGFRLLNQGLGAMTNSITQSVLLSTNASGANGILVGSIPFSGTIPAGQYIDQSLVVPGGTLSAPGTYWVVVNADAFDNALELNEANNSTISATPVVLATEYTATVRAVLTIALAGTPIPLTGSATLAGGGPAVNKPVNIFITVRGLQRTFGALTDTNGDFNLIFTPLPTEGGYYAVSAAAPGAPPPPAQDHFTILGMDASPNALSVTVTEGSNAATSATLENLSEVPLTGLGITTSGVAGNLSAKVTLATNYLAGMGTVTLSCTVSANDASIRQSGFTIHLTSAEGVTLDLPVSVSVQPLLPHLVAFPLQLSGTMLRGGQAVVQFDIVNEGGASSGPLTMTLPSAPWLTSASTNPLPSLSPGQTNRATLLLSPASDLALGPYSGTLIVNGSGASLLVPFRFTAVSDARGALRVHSTDEYTYFAPGNPPLTNATISVIEPFSGTVLASGIIDTNGLFLVTNLNEGTYELDLSADSHTPFRGTAVVTAGQTNDVEAFLSRQTVHFTWTVVPTNVTDVTHITVQAVFEANVPAPVVVPTPGSLDLASLQQPGQFMDVPLTLANYGLIAVQDVTITVSDHPLYRFDLLTKKIGTLPAHGTVTVPMRITRLAGNQHIKAGEPCTINFGIGYLYLCGVHDVSTAIAIPVFNVTGDCPPGGGGTVVIVGGCNGCGGGTYIIPPGNSTPSDCDQCMAKAILECAIGFIPGVGDAYGIWSCGAGLGGQGVNESTIETCVVSGIGIAAGKLGFGPIANVGSCLWSFLRCKCPQSISDGGFANCVGNLLGQLGGGGGASPDATVGLGLSLTDPRDVFAARSYPELQFLRLLVGDTDGRWFSSGSGGAFGAWFDGFSSAVQPGSPGDAVISGDETIFLLTLPRPDAVSAADVLNAIARWNLTITNWRAGLHSVTNVPVGGNTNFIDLYVLSGLMTQVANQYLAAKNAGYDSPQGGFFAALKDAESKLTGGGVCAHVVLQLDQDAVLTRDAFRATLQLDNNSSDPLMNVTVNVIVRNQVGQDVTGIFGVLPPTVSGALSAVNGTGLLPPNTSGAAQWTLIPTLDAAPTVQTNYLVSGTLSFVQNGVTITIPLAPSPITVQPNPQLYLKYFHQRDVFSDDPFTPEIEPAVPYSLAVLAQNRGYGAARDFHITSAQPKIVDNEKGLLIDFKIIGAQVGNQPAAPSLTVDFGDLLPGQTKVGRWLLVSSLQGLFINYSATFEHVDPLGNPRLSLIDGVEIHELTHLVQAPGAWDDGLPDFLVNDVADFNNLPDTLYLSDGSQQLVSVVQSASTDGPAGPAHLQVQLTATFPAGFSYLLVPDPGNGQFLLSSVLAGGGANLNTNDCYTTDRTFIGLGQPPIRENKLHLFDFHTNAGAYTYTLVYSAPSTVAQTNAPVSAVFSLPPHSPTTFGVVWSGANYLGQAPIAFYDVFLSDNGAPFTLWQTHTTGTGVLFDGVYGHSYAFYSVATDTAGNVEAAPSTPDATTMADLTNTPPTIHFSTNLVTLNEGDTLELDPVANDTDLPPQTLTFGLLPGAPFGATINSSSGQVHWTTSKGSGATTNVLGIVVTDNGFPPLSATGLVSVVIQRVNTAPSLAPISDYTINEGFDLYITNHVTDYDIPAQTFTWTLGPGAPTNATINPSTGLFFWEPVVRQGPSTNRISIIVTDSGVPPLSATQQFTVIVRHVLPDFVISVGSTNILTGESGTVPVNLASTLDLTNLTFQLGAPSSQFTNLSLQPLVAEVTSATLQPMGVDNYAARLTLNPALQVSETRSLAALAFSSISNFHSAIVPLPVSSPAAFRSNGVAVSVPSGFGGRVIVVGAESVLDLAAGPLLTLYGHPGATYELQYRTNLVSGGWTDFNSFRLAGRVTQLSGLAAFPSMTFYRAYELPASGPLFGLQSQGFIGPVLSLNLFGQTGTHYTVQTSTNLGLPAGWSDLFSLTLTNPATRFYWTNPGEPSRFFRVSSP